MELTGKYKILIVDDSEMNRTILTDILGEKFQILEAEDGLETIKMIKQYKNELSLILLDLVMPNMDGLEVLSFMNKYDWIDEIPVIMISAENAPKYIESAYELGVTDFINRPFNVFVVRKRVANTIILSEKQKNLVNLVNQQIYERVKASDMMLNILSHIVEFRNGESGLHILHVNTMTEILLKQLIKKTDAYKLSNADIETIVIASSLHDIGKISVPDEILNKPGKLTDEEFEIMKTHSRAGAQMLEDLDDYSDEPLVKHAHDICLYHHERYDGRGYPCALKGDDIPISAQVVALADVYDALTSKRCYKDAIPHQKAIEMIMNGSCGSFNPLLLECLNDVEASLEKSLKYTSHTKRSLLDVKEKTDEMFRQSQFSVSNNSINYLEQERIKNEFYASLSQEVQYEYTAEPPMLTISEWSANKFNLPQIIMDPETNEDLLKLVEGKSTLDMFMNELRKTTYDDPTTHFTIRIHVGGELRHHMVYCRVNWSTEDEPKIISTIGKIIDIEDEYRRIRALEKDANTDNLTGIYNRGYSEKLIRKALGTETPCNYALLLFDVDDFKQANDTYGHLFGDMVLKKIADTLNSFNKNHDIVARIGGDEFLMFVKYDDDKQLAAFVDSLYEEFGKIDCGDFNVSLSMGIARTKKVGTDFNSLFNYADSALYFSKRNGKGRYSYYEREMQLSDMKFTPIEN